MSSGAPFLPADSLGDYGYGEGVCHAPDGLLVDGVPGPLVTRAAVHGERRHAARLHHSAERQRVGLRGQQSDLT